MEFIFEGRGKAERTAHERIAIRNIRHAINFIVGGHYNTVQDHGDAEWLPKSRAALENEIYEEALNNLYGDGYMGCGKAPKEMRFAGEAFCRAYITWKLDQDSDIEAIGEYAGWNKECGETAESEGNQMNNKERFLLTLAAAIEGGKMTPIDTFYKHDDWYIAADVWALMPNGFVLSPDDMRELYCTKPSLMQHSEYGKKDTVYRITKAGWKMVEELRQKYTVEEPKTEPVLEVRTEKLQKIMDYVPWCKADAINACWKDSDGYWIQLNEGWVATRSTAEHTIHEDSLRQIGYQMGGVKKIGA